MVMMIVKIVMMMMMMMMMMGYDRWMMILIEGIMMIHDSDIRQ